MHAYLLYETSEVLKISNSKIITFGFAELLSDTLDFHFFQCRHFLFVNSGKLNLFGNNAFLRETFSLPKKSNCLKYQKFTIFTSRLGGVSNKTGFENFKMKA